MPKDDIDYSNTIVYKIFCSDKTVTDVYIGHTTNFTKRKYQHKISCGNLDNKLKIYNIIRQNGGWNNWNMVEISKYNCKDKTEARIKELYHYEELNSTLNSCPPWVDKSSKFCNICNLQCVSPKSYETHINCSRHKKIVIDQNRTNGNEKSPKSSANYVCALCDYSTSRKSQYCRHLATDKHVVTVLAINGNSSAIVKVPNDYTCTLCKKTYKDPSGLWRHKKKCQHTQNNTDDEATKIKIDNEPADKELIMILIKENSDLKHMMLETQNIMMEVIKTGTHNTTHTNSHNKTFNLQFFLNETCKDAMNITDFVNSIQLQLSDLVRVGELGYVDGISNIIIKNLKQLDVTKRPVHCTDKKREVLYVKDEDKWEKENTENKIIRKAIKKVSHKNILMLPTFKDAHPDCSKSDSKYSDQYNQIMVESFGGPGDDDSKKEDKIIKNISKTIVIEREPDPL
jgi:hypothetical protein